MSWVHMRSPPTSPNMRFIWVSGTAVRVRPTAWVPIWARGPRIHPSHTATCPAGSAETSSRRVRGAVRGRAPSGLFELAAPLAGPSESPGPPMLAAPPPEPGPSVPAPSGRSALAAPGPLGLPPSPSGSSWPTGRQ